VNERRYRGEPSRPIPVWNGILEHRERIGSAIWEFLWLIDKIEAEENGIGLVLPRRTVRASAMATDLGLSEKAVCRHLDRLEQLEYIRRKRAPYGYAVEVLNSRKFKIWSRAERPDNSVRSDPKEIGQKCPVSTPPESQKCPIYIKDSIKAKDSSAAALPKGEDSVWKFLGIAPCGMPGFRELLETGWASRNGTRPVKVIEDAVNAWEAVDGCAGRKALAPLFQVLSDLRARERQAPIDEGMHFLSPEELHA
jgi:hypothetical protein